MPLRGRGRPFLPEKRQQLKSRRPLICAAVLAGLIALPVLAALAVGWWLDYSDEPAPADILVVLAGRYSRPLYAADLYHKGYARAIWLSRPYRPPAELAALALGVDIPAEEEASREILIKKGVPAGSIRVYGEIVMSTANEASQLRKSLPPDARKLLVVTSRFHARRARWILHNELPGLDIRVAATPYEEFTRRWWSKQSLAYAGVTETAKTAYYLLGGRFLAKLEDTPHVQ